MKDCTRRSSDGYSAAPPDTTSRSRGCCRPARRGPGQAAGQYGHLALPQGRPMSIRCPHCRNPVESAAAVTQEMLCPACGSGFRVEAEATTDWAPRQPRRLGRFELLDAVGQGAFGTVYKARDPELDRTVAIKVPRAGDLAGAAELDRFLREARSVAQLRHPSIVSVYEVGQQDRLPYLVSEFVRGVTLADLLSARRPAPRESA